MANQILAAGTVLYKKKNGELFFAVIHRDRYQDWTFPKGKLEKGESFTLAAIRETKEETGFDCEIVIALDDVKYETPNGNKKLVKYWLAEYSSGKFKVNSEVDKLKWLSIDNTKQKLSYSHDVKLLKQAKKYLNEKNA